MESALGPRTFRAVDTPQWSQVDNPKLLVDRMRGFLRARGVVINRAEIVDIGFESRSVMLRATDGSRFTADRVVVAAGAWSTLLSTRLGDRALLEGERGTTQLSSIRRSLLSAS